MRFCNLFLVLLLNFRSLKAVEVPCERIRYDSSKYWCLMLDSTEISSDDVKFSVIRSENISVLSFSENRKIFFLPIEIHEKLPNLLDFDANTCSISTIGKKNFNKLSKIEVVQLAFNKIKRIESDTFDDLFNLEWVELRGNQIKFLNGRLFEMKPKLGTINLLKNVCIDRYADSIQGVQSWLPEITAQCGFDESKLVDINCGRISYISDRIIGGNEIVRGKWPFLVALILDSDGQFFCGGNLISSRHVLTAAHCLHNKGVKKQLVADDIAVLLGRHDLNARYERDSEQRKVAEIFMHTNWKNDTQKFDSDLALLVLKGEVQFSEFIQPVCLTKDASIMNHFDGTVIGWGKSESEAAHESIPREVSIRAVTTEVCFDKDPNLGNIYSPTTFCAGGEGIGPCKGDSGGGFFVNFRGLWTLRGIVSAGSLNNGGFSCDVGRFNLFTKLIGFSSWIRETVERS